MRAYLGRFVKRDGEVRNMKFAKLEDLPAEFLEANTKGSPARTLTEGMELVWDLDQKGFRIFNHSTADDGLQTIDVDASTLTL